MKYAVGVDLGGTKISAGLVDSTGRLLNKTKIGTEADKGPKHVIGNIIRSITAVSKDMGVKPKDIAGAGIGSPGPLDAAKGIIHFAPNLPGWKEIKLKDIVQKEFPFPVHVDNDANVAAYGENWTGAGKKVNYFLFVTLGTGVGGGLIVNNEIFHGTADSAMEIGHVTVFPDGRKCNCGNYGCLERYASATGIVITAKEFIAAGKKTLLTKTVLSSKAVHDAALKKDKVAIDILTDAGRCLGIVIANTASLLNLDMVALGGNVAEAGEFIFKPVREEIKKRVLFPANRIKVVKAKLGVDAGLIGAARLVFSNAGVA